MHRRRHAGAAAQRVLEVDRPAVFFQKIAERLVSQFGKILHLVAAEEIDLPPGLVVELHALAGHQLASLCRPFERAGFLTARGAERAVGRRAPPPPFTLCRSASIRLTTLEGARSFGDWIFSPFCFLRSKSLSASS